MNTDLPDLSLSTVKQMMAVYGVRQLFAKVLSANDNSKNQPYFGGSLDILNILPLGEIREEATAKGREGLKASLPFSWLLHDGNLMPAKGAQLILYPKYPEIRFSGFLKGTKSVANDLMTRREEGRILFLGITADRRIIGWVVGRDSQTASEFRSLGNLALTGVFAHVPLDNMLTPRDRLIGLLSGIHKKGWIESWRMGSAGERLACSSSQCGGYTLEAELGIVANGRAEPDFDGWEVKAHSVSSFTSAGSNNITLMTPEPTGGYYRTGGVEAFVRKYGYPDTHGRPDRLNFGGVHVIGQTHPRTGLTMRFIGFDTESKTITDPKGGFALFDSKGVEAATWHFAGLLQHWNRKHAKAAYVPFMQMTAPERKYSYSNRVRLCEGTDFTKFLSAMATGSVIYDPGIKLENASGSKPNTKRRSQFRIKSTGVETLYSTTSLELLV